jgi:hypothetical protein
MSLITPAQLIEHIETDRSDDALQQIIDAEELDIVQKFGPHATQDDDLTGGHQDLGLSRPASTITTVVETIGTTETALSANDYELRNGGRILYRLSTGTHARTAWGNRVEVAYVPRTENARRIMVLIDLCRLALKYTGLLSETTGDYQYSAGALRSYQENRNDVLNRLINTVRPFS